MITTVVLHCCRCGQRLAVDLTIRLNDYGDFVLPGGTLNNEWALRWIRSHAEPSAQVVV